MLQPMGWQRVKYDWATELNWDLLCVLSHSVMSNSLWQNRLQPSRLLCPWEFSRQEYWSGLPCPSPGDLPNPGIESRCPTLQADSLPSEPPEKVQYLLEVTKIKKMWYRGKDRQMIQWNRIESPKEVLRCMCPFTCHKHGTAVGNSLFRKKILLQLDAYRKTWHLTLSYTDINPRISVQFYAKEK